MFLFTTRQLFYLSSSFLTHVIKSARFYCAFQLWRKSKETFFAFAWSARKFLLFPRLFFPYRTRLGQTFHWQHACTHIELWWKIIFPSDLEVLSAADLQLPPMSCNPTCKTCPKFMHTWKFAARTSPGAYHVAYIFTYVLLPRNIGLYFAGPFPVCPGQTSSEW